MALEGAAVAETLLRARWLSAVEPAVAAADAWSIGSAQPI
jgi:hypothetical protein